MKEEKIHLLRDLTNFNEISRKNTTYDNTKSYKKKKAQHSLQRQYFLKHNLRFKA